MTHPDVDDPQPVVVSVARSPDHHFSKVRCETIEFLTGLGVSGDAHSGITVKHRSRVRVDPSQPNLRQVHLVQSELFGELAMQGFTLEPGDIGENVLTRGVDLLALPRGTRLHLGAEAIVEVTGLRNPCGQLDSFRKGLTQAVLDHAENGELIRKAGVMAIVLSGGSVSAGDQIRIELPALPHQKLDRV